MLFHFVACHDCGAVVVAVLRGPLSDHPAVVEQGLLAVGNLAVRADNSKLLRFAGACEGEWALFLDLFSKNGVFVMFTLSGLYGGSFLLL